MQIPKPTWTRSKLGTGLVGALRGAFFKLLSDRQRAVEIDTPRKRLLYSEQVRLLYESTPLVVLSTLLVSSLLVAVQWTVVDHRGLLLWWGVSASVSTLRGMLWYHYRRRGSRDHRSPAYWCRVYTVGAVAGGATWGLAAILALPSELVNQQVTPAIITTGVAAFGSTTLAAVWRIVPIFLVACLVPWALRFALMDTSATTLIALMTLVFVGFLTVSARRVHDSIVQNISLRLDVAEREQTLRESEERYRQIFRYSPLGMLHYDSQGTVVECNDALAMIVGVKRSKLVGRSLLRDCDNPEVESAARASLDTGNGYYEGGYKVSGQESPVPVRGFFRGIRSVGGRLVGGVCIVEDFSERKRSEELIRRQASYDDLTDLPNRRFLVDRLEQALAARRRHGRSGALLFLDLDHFKNVNDSLGHSVGDLLLSKVADRLRDRLRSEDIAARLGGDEFVVLMPDAGDDREQAADRAGRLADDLNMLLSQPYSVAGNELHVTPSIGVAVFPAGDETADDVLIHADTAMYGAKHGGRNTTRFYLKSMQDALDERLALEKDLREAVSAGRLQVHLQPEVDQLGRISGAEVLLRWQHHTRGWVSPNTFVPLAEEAGLILPIGHCVLEQACLAVRTFDQMLDLEKPTHLSVNVSPRQFHQVDFVSQVRRVLDHHEVEPARLTLEITEGLLVQNTGDSVEKMEALQEIGVRFAIDDFGTGYSSLSYLKNLPMNVLKIDQSFVRDIATGSRDAAIVETIIGMAQNLGLQVCAEGVETRQEFDFLRALGCTAFQGYYFSAALPIPELVELLQSSGGVLMAPADAA